MEYYNYFNYNHITDKLGQSLDRFVPTLNHFRTKVYKNNNWAIVDFEKKNSECVDKFINGYNSLSKYLGNTYLGLGRLKLRNVKNIIKEWLSCDFDKIYFI